MTYAILGIANLLTAIAVLYLGETIKKLRVRLETLEKK